MPDNEPEPTTEDAPTQESDTDSTDWQAEAEKWKALSRKHESQAKSNADKAQKFDELQEAQKSEVEKLTEAQQAAAKEAADAKRDAARMRVALSKGLSEAQAKRLVGDTVEELEADADELLETFAPSDNGDDDKSRRPQEALKPGATTPDEEPDMDPDKLAADILSSGF